MKDRKLGAAAYMRPANHGPLVEKWRLLMVSQHEEAVLVARRAHRCQSPIRKAMAQKATTLLGGISLLAHPAVLQNRKRAATKPSAECVA